MIKLKLHIDKSQFSAFTFAVNHYCTLSFDLLESEQYIHYYNVNHIMQECVKRIFTFNHNTKKILLSLGLNEYESLKYLFLHSNQLLDLYANSVFVFIISELEKQVTNIKHYTLYNGKENNTYIS